MYYFSIPDSILTRLMNNVVLNSRQKHPEWFYDDVVLETAYGVPFFCIWNGNRDGDGYIEPGLKLIRNVLAYYNSYGIRYRMTFTNFMLRREHLYDTVGNKFAQEADKLHSDVTVSLPMMAEYMRKTYPNLHICWSTTTEYQNPIEQINERSEKDIVVLPIEYNNNWEELKKFKHPENLEVILNENCIDNCPRRREHFAKSNKAYLFEEEDMSGVCYFPLREGDPYPRTRCVSRKDFEKYAELGITHFKIAGRQLLVANGRGLGEDYLEYLIRPEYHVECRKLYKEASASGNSGESHD